MAHLWQLASTAAVDAIAFMWVVAVTQAALKIRRLQRRCDELRDRLEELKR